MPWCKRWSFLCVERERESHSLDAVYGLNKDSLETPCITHLLWSHLVITCIHCRVSSSYVFVCKKTIFQKDLNHGSYPPTSTLCWSAWFYMCDRIWEFASRFISFQPESYFSLIVSVFSPCQISAFTALQLKVLTGKGLIHIVTSQNMVWHLVFTGWWNSGTFMFQFLAFVDA